MDDREKCLLINSLIPEGGLFTGEKREIHPESKASSRISPEPFWVLPEELEWFEELGTHLLRFYRASNLLYSQSVRGIQPSWVSAYLDRGKPEAVIEYNRMNRFKSQIPQVIRPDVIPSDDGMIITELDSVPGFIGGTGCLGWMYAELNYNVVGGSDGMVHGFAEMIRSLAKVESPTLAIVVSDESDDYWAEMEWLASVLVDVGLSAYTLKPHEVSFTEEGLFVQSPHGAQTQIDVLYRFFELFDLKNIPKAELMLYAAKKRSVVMTPPPRAHLEEKSLFALFHHPTLRRFWEEGLGKKTYAFLENVLPETWVLDPRPLPPTLSSQILRLMGFLSQIGGKLSTLHNDNGSLSSSHLDFRNWRGEVVVCQSGTTSPRKSGRPLWKTRYPVSIRPPTFSRNSTKQSASG